MTEATLAHHPEPARTRKPAKPAAQNQDPTALIKLATGLPEISVVIPDNATLGEVCNTLSVAVRGFNFLDVARDKLKPIIGRLLLTVQERRMWKSEYKSMGEFINVKITTEMGLSRATAYDAIRLVRAFPKLTEKDYARFGGRRLSIAARITSSAAVDHMEILQRSLLKTADAFEEEVQELLAASAPKNNLVSCSMRIPLRVKQRWNKLLETTEVAPGTLLDACISAYKATLKTKAKPQETIAA